MPKVKALTLQDPYGTLIANGHKQYETRGWKTPHRGLLVIHVGKTLSINWDDRVFMSLLRDCGITDPYKLPLGCGIAICKLTAVYRTEDVWPHIGERERAFGLWTPGRAAWKLEDVQKFPKPIPARGQQYLWDWTLPLPEGIAV